MFGITASIERRRPVKAATHRSLRTDCAAALRATGVAARAPQGRACAVPRPAAPAGGFHAVKLIYMVWGSGGFAPCSAWALPQSMLVAWAAHMVFCSVGGARPVRGSGDRLMLVHGAISPARRWSQSQCARGAGTLNTRMRPARAALDNHGRRACPAPTSAARP